jgi:drug/metabolite transporter (DMT)-like permease
MDSRMNSRSVDIAERSATSENAPASVLAPFFYAQLLFAVILGAVIFHELPDRYTFLGGSVVMGSGLYLLYRERVRHKEPSIDISA